MSAKYSRVNVWDELGSPAQAGDIVRETFPTIDCDDDHARRLYKYYMHSGIWRTMFVHLSSALTILASAFWFWFFLAIINWHQLDHSILKSPFDPMDAAGVIGLLVFIAGMILFVLQIIRSDLKLLWKTHRYIQSKGIDNVEDMTWIDFCRAIGEDLNRNPLIQHPVETEMTMRINREADFMTALQDLGVLDDIYGWVPRSRVGQHMIQSVLVGGNIVYGQSGSAHWSQLVQGQFQYQILCSFVYSLFISPFLFCLMFVRAVGRMGEEYQTHRGGMMSHRLVTVRGMDAMREYMELPHELNFRASLVAMRVSDLVALQGLHWPATLSYLLTLPFLVLVTIGLVHEDALIESTVLGYNLIWWIALLALVISTLRSMAGNWTGYWAFTSERSGGSADASTSSDIQKIARCWPGYEMMGFNQRLRLASSLAPSQVVAKLKDLIGTLLIPILFIRMFRRSDWIQVQVNSLPTTTPGIGCVCVYSTLDESHVSHKLPLAPLERLRRSASSTQAKIENPRASHLTASMML